MKSILQNEKQCYVTGSTINLHKHHIFNASNRKHSEKYGLWVYLRADWHNMSDYGVHFNKEFSDNLKAEAQEKAMEYYDWSVADFRRIFGKNYI